MSTGHLVVGAGEHGVVRFAEDVIADAADPVVRASSVDDLIGDWWLPLLGCAVVHVHYTDRLFGPRCEDAAARFAALAAALHDRAQVAVCVTLHDLPQRGDGAVLARRRAGCYRVVVHSVDAVVVSSEHEAALLAALGAPARPVTVIPLPVDPAVAVTPGRTDGQISVLGFVHPGKGHRAALQAMATLPAAVGMTVLGRAADGHEDLLAELAYQATAGGRRLQVTGYLPGADLAVRLQAAGVPLAPNEAVSASASINTWLSAGRRPLVPCGPYAAELQRRLPGTLCTYRPEALTAALRTALRDPASTWLPPGVRLGPSRTEVALAYSDVWAQVAGG